LRKFKGVFNGDRELENPLTLILDFSWGPWPDSWPWVDE